MVLFTNIMGSDIIEMYPWRTDVPNKLVSKQSICNEDSSTDAALDPHLQSPDPQVTEALQLPRYDLWAAVFRDFIGHF